MATCRIVWRVAITSSRGCTLPDRHEGPAAWQRVKLAQDHVRTQPDLQAVPDGVDPARRLAAGTHRLDREQVVPLEHDLAYIDRVAVGVAREPGAFDEDRGLSIEDVTQPVSYTHLTLPT